MRGSIIRYELQEWQPGSPKTTVSISSEEITGTKDRSKTNPRGAEAEIREAETGSKRSVVQRLR